jgi:hypothetical protein
LPRPHRRRAHQHRCRIKIKINQFCTDASHVRADTRSHKKYFLFFIFYFSRPRGHEKKKLFFFHSHGRWLRLRGHVSASAWAIGPIYADTKKNMYIKSRLCGRSSRPHGVADTEKNKNKKLCPRRRTYALTFFLGG